MVKVKRVYEPPRHDDAIGRSVICTEGIICEGTIGVHAVAPA